MFVLLLNFISSSSAQLHLMFFWHSAERKENEWKKRRFSSHSKKQNFSHFHSTQSKNAPLSAECRIKTHRKLLQKQKNFHYCSQKKAFYSIFTLCEGSGNHRKKWPQDVLYFRMDDLWVRISIPACATTLSFCCRRGEYCSCQTLRPTLFTNFRLPHHFFSTPWNVISVAHNCKIMSDRTDEFFG